MFLGPEPRKSTNLADRPQTDPPPYSRCFDPQGAGVRNRTVRPPSRPLIVAVAWARDGHDTHKSPARFPDRRSLAW
jgi:hypothetical protein